MIRSPLFDCPGLRWLGLALLLPIGGCPVGLLIAGTTFLIVLGAVGNIAAPANQTTRTAGVVALDLNGPPSDQPGSAMLRVGTVQALPLDSAKVRTAAQSLSGTATVRVFVGAASETNPCETGVEVGAFGVGIAGGSTTISNPELDVPAAAMPFLRAGEFTICLEVRATIDVNLVIDRFECTFGQEGDVSPDEPDLDGVEPDLPDPHDMDPDDGPDDGPDGDPADRDGDGVPDASDGCPDDADKSAPGACGCGVADADENENGTPDCDEDFGGFTPAIVIHSGSEQVVAGPEVDPAFSAVTPPGYNVRPADDTNNGKMVALSGHGTVLWFQLYDEFPDVDGDPQTQLWYVNFDGSGAARVALPDEDWRLGAVIETTQDGSDCVLNNWRLHRFYRASRGDASVAYMFDGDDDFDFDIRSMFKLADDGLRLYFRDFEVPRVGTFNLTVSPLAPSITVENIELALQGVNPRSLSFEFDVAGDTSAYIFQANYSSGSLTPSARSQTFVGSGDSGIAGLELLRNDPSVVGDNTTPYDLNITDDGRYVAYCIPSFSAGINAPNDCVRMDLQTGDQVLFGDGRTRVGSMKLADNGAVAVYRTDACCGHGTGIIETLGVGKTAFGSGWFEPDVSRGRVQVSDNGRIFATNCPDGLYVLRDGATILDGDWPRIENIWYRYNDDCTMTVMVRTANTPRGIARLWLRALYDGVEASRSVEGAENPFFPIRGSGPNFVPVADAPGFYELTFGLTNSSGDCVEQVLTPDSHFRLRVSLVDGNETIATYQDFDPVQ